MKKKSVYFVLLSLFVGACTQEDIEPSFHEDLNISSKETITSGISPDITNLESSDAEIVANRFINNNVESRSESRCIKNVVTVPNAEGEPVMYAVNFDKGYVLVSATKNLAPILAVVDNGSFSLEDMPSGRDIIVSQLISEADYWQKNGGNNEHNEEWQYFTKLPDDEHPKALSRTVIDSDPWTAMYAQMIEFEDMGYECCRLSRFEDDQDFMPNNILEKFKSTARTEDNIWEQEYGENFMYETAIVVKKDKPSYGSSGYCLKTSWGQRSPYNCMLDGDYPLGCVTIAVGQIMKYHEYPKTFEWSNMPNTLIYEGSTPLTNFLKRIHDELRVTNDGAANDQDAVRVLKSYGYGTSLKNHTSAVTKYPTYCGGYDSQTNEGHAWVCDGSSRYTFHIVYELYVFDYSGYPNFQYTLRSEEHKYSDSEPMYHMNWGNFGQNDGYYFDNNLKINTSHGIYNFCKNRTDIFITKP